MPAHVLETPVRTREERAGLLAQAHDQALLALADRCLGPTEDPLITKPPETGMVMLTVREPVESIRFHLGEVLVTRCEVVHRDHHGWAMRMGSAPATALASAVLDAEAQAGGPFAAEIASLCEETSRQRADADAREWQAVAETIVDFEEMD